MLIAYIQLLCGIENKMTIDFKNNRIYHFDKDLNLAEHKPISTEFMEIEVLRNGKLLIVENYYQYDNDDKSNLYCLNHRMEVEWFLPYPQSNANSMDNYVGFTTNGDRVFANTFSCHRVEIDTEEGSIISTVFTK
jgi:hypothetical protein